MRNRNNKRQSRFTPNKIDYIVFGNPKEAKQLVHNYGYEPPRDIEGLSETVKLLVKKKGKKVVKDLLGIHPDKNIILRLNQSKEDSFCGACGSSSYIPEDNYCGSCGHSNYTGKVDIGDFLDQLVEMNTAELENYYQEVLSKSNKSPKDMKLADEVQIVWNELRQRMNAPEKEEKKEEGSFYKHVIKSELAIAGVILVAGILIGTAFKSSKQHG